MTAPHSSTLLNESVSKESNEIPRPLVGGQRNAEAAAAAITVGGTAEEQAQREDAAYAAGAKAAAERVTTRPFTFPAAPAITPRVVAPTLAPTFAAPQPQVVYVAAPDRNGGVSVAAFALIVVILAIVAGLAAYIITEQNAPSAQEAARLQTLAANQAYLNGTAQGVSIGQQWGQDAQRAVAATKARIAGERAYAKAVAAGKKAGAASYKPTPYSTYGGGYYRGPRYGGFGNGSVSQGLAVAQDWANRTNAPVDVEIY